MAAISHESILRMGRYREMNLAGVDPQLIRALYQFMVRLRRCEEALMEEYHPADEMRCPVHFCVGQEAVPSALSLLIEPDDYLFSHHRTHGYYLAKGAPMNALFAEMYGRDTGANGGIAGSQDISMPNVRFYSGAIVSGAVAISAGAGLGLQLQGRPNVAVAGFGEGAAEEGIFWEAMNYAVLRKLPVLFICENNRYATHSEQVKRQPADNLSDRVKALGVKSRAIFGNDVIAVHTALAEAIAHVRGGHGPFFVEAYTYRWHGHVGPEDEDHLGYRPQSELEFWKTNCPIELLEEQMTAYEQLTPAIKAEIVGEIDAEIADAFSFAKSSPFPGQADWLALNYNPASPLADKLLSEAESVDFNENQAITVPKPY